MKTFFSPSAESYSFEEFTEKLRNNEIDFMLKGSHHYKLLMGVRKYIFYFFMIAYMIMPIIVIPIISLWVGNWWLLFGILISYLASGMASFKKLGLLFAYTIFCIVVWVRIGFNIHQYITFFFFCAWWGYMMFSWADGVEEEYAK